MTVDQDIRVVGLDLDGTLLRDDKTISEWTRHVLEQAALRGIYVLPATGRTRTGIPDFVQAIEGIQYGVCSNGATVVDLSTGEEIYSSKLSYEDSLRLLDIIEGYHTMHDCYIEGEGYTEERYIEELSAYGVEPKIQELIKNTRTSVKDLRQVIEELQCPVEKFNMFFQDLNKREKVLKELSKLPFIKVTSSLTNNLEINAADCNKGSALLGFAKAKGFSKEQVMCCGDGNNDYDMIRMCGIGVAMTNGVENIKEAADYITYTNNEDGAAKAIVRLCFRMQDFENSLA
ncbi:MAG: Cof-type HAD-IIB family hydrolase [Lachnospiraceae bacterium]|nr:Cof-type HAD-IIB family hydrolase [Lachnospiraceae bacterium]